MKGFLFNFCRIGQVLVTASISTATIWTIAPTPATAATFTLDSSNNNSGTFGFTGSIDAVNITTAGTYTIDAFGAEGGADGGLGGQVKANFTFAANTFLRILVGGRGFDAVGTGGGGGGGGTLVKNGNTLLIVAGGGGGGGFSGGGGGGGSFGSISTSNIGNGGNGNGNASGFGGTGGYDRSGTLISFQNSFQSGNGAIAIIFNDPATAVPEPFTLVGTLVGGAAALRMRKKLKFDRIDRQSCG